MSHVRLAEMMDMHHLWTLEWFSTINNDIAELLRAFASGGCWALASLKQVP